MIQMPILTYPNFSQLLQLQQQQHYQNYSRQFLNQNEMLSNRSATSCSETSTGTSTPSPSPPLLAENTPKNSQNITKTKSFTIDAILGIRDNIEGLKTQEHYGANPFSSFHGRLALTGSFHPRLEMSDSTRTNRLDMSRLSSARDVLGLNVPTDLTTTAPVGSNSSSLSEGVRRDHAVSFHPVNSCSRITDKSVNSDSTKKCGGKSKRVRTIFTPEQLERLEAEFERQQYMVGPERLYLAHTLQLTEAQVKVWFQNRRIKWRKQHLEIQQQRLAAIKQQQQRSEVEDSDSESNNSNSQNNYNYNSETTEAQNSFYKTTDNQNEGERTSYQLNSFDDSLQHMKSEKTETPPSIQ